MSFNAWSVVLQLVPCSLLASGRTAGRGGGRLRCSAHTGESEAKQKMLASVTVFLKQILTRSIVINVNIVIPFSTFWSFYAI